MADLHFKADINASSTNYIVGLSLVEFEEDGVTIIYSPALDLSGYGMDSQEAKESFDEAFKEFFRYTQTKKTFDKVLKELGWKLKGQKHNKRYSPPKNSDLIIKNELFNTIVNKGAYKVRTEPIQFAL